MPLISEHTPILHDPVSHALWAKDIFERGTVHFFYSPLLHIIVAILHSAGQIVSIPTLVLWVTALSAALTPLTWALLVKELSKSWTIAIAVLILTSIFHFPSNLYFLAGKNALVLGLFLAPVAIYFCISWLRDQKVRDLLFCSCSLIMLFLSHYPVWIIVMVILLFPFAKTLTRKFTKRDSIRSYLLDALTLVVPLLINGFFLIYWIFVRDIDNAVTNSLPSLISASVSATSTVIVLKNTLISLRNNLRLDPAIFTTLALATVGLPLFLKKKTPLSRLSYGWFLLSPLLLYIVLALIEEVYDLRIVNITIEIIYPWFLVVATGYTLGLLLDLLSLKKVSLAPLILTVTSIVLFSNFLLLSTINVQKQDNVVSDYDLNAYQFINKNIPAGSLFLNSAKVSETNPNVVYPTDGGMWIPVYTDNNITMDFLEFSSDWTKENYLLFESIVDNDMDDTDSMAALKAIGVEYIYIDKGIYGHSLEIGELNNIDYKIIFESGPVKILDLN
jgi:hypothetical protein